jgi:hypothetical protein
MGGLSEVKIRGSRPTYAFEMGAHVLLLIRAAGEAVVAEFACKGLFSCVNALVASQITLLQQLL